eukprot:TRINITY_DN13994_c0_g1_i1.p1 TRINITY_DN13994_c0_g1~~TRINITY_DN13994_c0_g1_i1.p1  ORF type:complete len:266 (-),score=41.14 TRINITY_DN13994_c0_g1_i1:725-1474(-)
MGKQKRPTGFKEMRIKLLVSLQPSFLPSIKAGIDKVLSSYLLRFVPEVGGVIIAYWDTKLLEQSARIMYCDSHFHFNITTKVLVFAPEPGQRLQGTVNLVSADHIGMLVFGTFNASIPAKVIRARFRADDSGSRWVDTHDNSTVFLPGQTISFEVTKVDVADNLVSVQGSLMADDTGPTDDAVVDMSATNLSASSADKEKTSEKRKKEKSSEEAKAAHKRHRGHSHEDRHGHHLKKAKSSSKAKPIVVA